MFMNDNGNGNGNGQARGNPGWWLPFRRLGERPEMDLSAYRRLALQLHYEMPRGEKGRSVLVATARHSHAAAQAGAALARCLADEVQRPVLLIDAAPRREQLSRILGCGGEQGLTDALADPLHAIADLARPTTHPNVSFLPAGSPAGSPQPEQLPPLLEKAHRAADFVVLAGAALLEDSLALAFAPLVGRVLLLAVENETMIDDLDAAKESLRHCHAQRVGLVLTTPFPSRQWTAV